MVPTQRPLIPEASFALAIDGPRTVRPGDTVRLTYRAHNRSGTISAPALLTFNIPEGCTAIDPDTVDIAPIAPGSESLVALHLRVGDQPDNFVTLPIQAELASEGRILGSNIVRLDVQSRADLHGRVALTWGAQPGTVDVALSLANTGDGRAYDVRVVSPVPLGCAEPSTPTTWEIPLIAPGATLKFGYAAPVNGTDARALADGGSFFEWEGQRFTLAADPALVLEPSLAPPVVTIHRFARRADITIVIANRGWADARDVAVNGTLSPAWRIAAASAAIEGAPASLVRGGIVVPFIAARGEATITFAAFANSAQSIGSATIACGSDSIDVAIPPPSFRALRIVGRVEHPDVAPGYPFTIATHVENLGDAIETVVVTAGAREAESRSIAPGEFADVTLTVDAAAGLVDGEEFAIPVTARSADGIVTAEASVRARARDRRWLILDAIHIDDSGVDVTIRNAGTSDAPNVALRGTGTEATAEIGTIAAGASVTTRLEKQFALHGIDIIGGSLGAIHRDLPDLAGVAPVRAVLETIARARAGETIAIRLHLVADQLTGAVVVRAQTPAARYVAGSTSINAHVIADGHASEPLAGDGLHLHEIAAGTAIVIAWSIVPEVGATHLTVAPQVDADGRGIDVAPVEIEIVARPAFNERPSTLPFYLDADVLERAVEPALAIAATSTAPPPPPIALPPTPAADAMSEEHRSADADAEHATPSATMPLDEAATASGHETAAFAETAVDAAREDGAMLAPATAAAATVVLRIGMRLDNGARETVVRLLRGAGGPGIVPHIFALRALFPDAIAHDGAANAAVLAARNSVRDVLDRLYVKIRMPEYRLSAEQYEDRAMREALIALFDALAAELRRGAQPIAADAYAEIDGEHIRAAQALLVTAPLGSPLVFDAVATIVPAEIAGDPAGSAALTNYTSALRDELARYRGLPGGDADSRIAGMRVPELDAARGALIDALEARVPAQT